MKIQSTKKQAKTTWQKIAVHGTAGMGKTMLAATCPKPIIILTEQTGQVSLRESNIQRVFGKGKKDIQYELPYLEAYDVASFEKAIKFVEDDDRFETIIFDSVSEASKLLLKEEKPKFKNGMQAYGAMAEHMDDLIRYMRGVKKHTVYLFHSEKDEIFVDGEEFETVLVPSFEGRKMQGEFPYLIGDIYYLGMETGEDDDEPRRYLRTEQADSPFFAKSRGGMLNELELPHLGNIIKKLSK